MRRPRVRFTVGTLLFAVALVAANCRVFGPLYQQVRYNTAPAEYRVPHLYLGLIPLVNVAAIGSFFVVRARLRSLRSGHVVGPGSCWSALTYFSIHFLILIGLIHWFMPNAIGDCWRTFQVALERAAEAWDTVLGKPGMSLIWMIFACSLYGVLLSGPPLVVSAAGHLLARRYAATMPRARFRALACLVTLGFASAALAICLTPQPFEDELDVALDLQVIDESSGRPITGAFVCLTDPFDHHRSALPPRALTDDHGRARLTSRFAAEGERNAFQNMGVFSPWGRWLEVSSVGHCARRILLTEILGPFADAAGPAPFKVALTRGERQADAFADLSGLYANPGIGYGGHTLNIEPDGRFAWCEWGCCPPHLHVYGRLKRYDRAIKLVPVPHAGSDLESEVTLHYWTIEWGARHYLFSSEDQGMIRGFCRAALGLSIPPDSEFIRAGSLRESDRDRPRTGQPRLPLGLWVTFVANELSLGCEEGSLRRALDALFRGSSEEDVVSRLDAAPEENPMPLFGSR